MKYWELIRFEFAFQVRRPAVWLTILVSQLLLVLITESLVDNVQDGEFFYFSPLAIAMVCAFGPLFSLLLTASLAGDAATRDVTERLDPLLYTSSLRKGTFLAGRLTAVALFSALVVLVMIPVALFLVPLKPGVELEPEMMGIFSFGAFLEGYLLFALPTVLASSVLLFAAALLLRNTAASFGLGVFLFFMSLIGIDILMGELKWYAAAKLLDVSAYGAIKEVRKLWTADQLHYQSGSDIPWVLYNRLMWLGIMLLTGLLMWLRYDFRHHTARSWRLFRRRSAASPSTSSLQPVEAFVPDVPRAFTTATAFRQLLHLGFRLSREVVSSWLLVPIGLFLGFCWLIAPELVDGPVQVPLAVSTSILVLGYSMAPFKVILGLLIVMMSAQLLWRERDARIQDLVDAAPLPDCVLAGGKALALLLLILTLLTAWMLVAVTFQLLQGYPVDDPALMLQVFYGFKLIDLLLLAAMIVAVQTLVNHKLLGYVVLAVLFGLMILPMFFGIENKLWVYGSDYGWSYSEIRGFSASLSTWFCFKLYWGGAALVLMVVALVFWVRGRETHFRQRRKLALRRFGRSLQITTAAACLLFASTGAYLHLQTAAEAASSTTAADLARKVAYERTYSQYRHLPQPIITAMRLHVEYEPQNHRALVQGRYVLRNHTNAPMQQLHFDTHDEVRTRITNISHGGRVSVNDTALQHQIVDLAQPLQPGDSLTLEFVLNYQPAQLPSGGESDVTPGFAYFNSRKWVPTLGYTPGRELKDKGDRKLRGLPPRRALLSPYDSAAAHLLTGREAYYLEVIIGTDPAHVAVAPGTLQRTWEQNDRRYFHYVTTAPVGGFAILSAPYAVARRTWRDKVLEVYHFPGHGRNVQRMLDGMQASLEYMTTQLTPYPHRELRMIEFAGGGGLTAYPATVVFSESFAAMAPERDERDFDMVYAVTGHEVAHQWWGHQVVPAVTEGAVFLAESMAWYTSMGMVEATKGEQPMYNLLNVFRESYLDPHSKADVPLLRADDTFQGYRKGPFAMHSLRGHLGDSTMNVALRRLLHRFPVNQTPLPRSVDLYQELQAVTPDSLRPLLHDLIAQNTFWNIKAQRATAVAKGTGYEVQLTYKIRKEAVDSAGVETELPMNQWVEVVAYSPHAMTDGRYHRTTIYRGKHRLQSGTNQLVLQLPSLPGAIVIDPRHLLIDPYGYDNSVDVDVVNGPGGKVALSER